MEGNLKWGLQVHKTLNLMRANGNVVLIIRHSERPEIKTLKNESEIEITSEGRKVAVKLGEAIRKTKMNSNFQVFSWGSLRCIQTAQAIAKGLKNNDNDPLEPISARFQSPINSLTDYQKAFASGKWNDFIQDWLNNRPQKAMLPVPFLRESVFSASTKRAFSR